MFAPTILCAPLTTSLNICLIVKCLRVSRRGGLREGKEGKASVLFPWLCACRHYQPPCPSPRLPLLPWVVLETLRLMSDSHTLGLSQVDSRAAGEPRRTVGISGSLWAWGGAQCLVVVLILNRSYSWGLLSSLSVERTALFSPRSSVSPAVYPWVGFSQHFDLKTRVTTWFCQFGVWESCWWATSLSDLQMFFNS